MGQLLGLLVFMFAALALVLYINHKPKSLGELLARIFSDKPAKIESEKPTAAYPHYSCETLLSEGELAFYHILKKAMGDEYTILMKVRLADIIACNSDARRAGYFGKISQKHVDFVLVIPRDSTIVAVIELNDKSHQRASRMKRDLFLADALRAAEVPIAVFEAAPSYDVGTVRTAILDVCVSLQG